MTHQTSWLESTGVCGVRQNQAGGSSVRKGNSEMQYVIPSATEGSIGGPL